MPQCEEIWKKTTRNKVTLISNFEEKNTMMICDESQVKRYSEPKEWALR